MVKLYPPQFCVLSNVERQGGAKLSCLDARTMAVTHTTVSSVAEAEPMIWLTFFYSVVLVMTASLLLTILSRLLATARTAGRPKELGRTGWSGNPRIVRPRAFLSDLEGV